MCVRPNPCYFHKKLSLWLRKFRNGQGISWKVFFFFSVAAWLPAAEKAGKLCRDFRHLPFFKRNKRNVLGGGVHTTSKIFENATLFLMSTLIRHENGGFRKTLFKPEECENAGFSFSCGRKTFWRRSFSKPMGGVTIIVWYPYDRVFLKHKSKMTGECCVIKFLWSSLDRTHLCFQCETDVSKSLWPCVDGALALMSAASALC